MRGFRLLQPIKRRTHPNRPHAGELLTEKHKQKIRLNRVRRTSAFEEIGREEMVLRCKRSTFEISSPRNEDGVEKYNLIGNLWKICLGRVSFEISLILDPT